MSATPQPWFDLRKRLKDVEEQLRKLRNTSPFSGTGMSVPADGVTQVDGNLNVVGTETVSGSLNVTGNETVGGTLNVTGNTVIGGTLSLPAGIINNDALANPVIPQSVWKGTTADFSLNTSWSQLTSQTQNAPSGATSVIVHGFVRLVATNTTASKDYLYSDLDIGGASCGGFATPVAAGDVGTSFCSFARVLTGVSSVTLKAYGSTSTGTWATGTGNICQISASVLWFR